MSPYQLLLLGSLSLQISCGGGSPATEGGGGPSVSKASTAIPNACDVLTEAIAQDVLGGPVHNYSSGNGGDQRSSCAYSPPGDKYGVDSIKLQITPRTYTGITIEEWKQSLEYQKHLLGPYTIKPFGEFASSTSNLIHILSVFQGEAFYELTANPKEGVEGMTSESMTHRAAELIFGANTY
jgi:hypothetical protein